MSGMVVFAHFQSCEMVLSFFLIISNGVGLLNPPPPQKKKKSYKSKSLGYVVRNQDVYQYLKLSMHKNNRIVTTTFYVRQPESYIWIIQIYLLSPVKLLEYQNNPFIIRGGGGGGGGVNIIGYVYNWETLGQRYRGNVIGLLVAVGRWLRMSGRVVKNRMGGPWSGEYCGSIKIKRWNFYSHCNLNADSLFRNRCLWDIITYAYPRYFLATQYWYVLKCLCVMYAVLWFDLTHDTVSIFSFIQPYH